MALYRAPLGIRVLFPVVVDETQFRHLRKQGRIDLTTRGVVNLRRDGSKLPRDGLNVVDWVFRVEINGEFDVSPA